MIRRHALSCVMVCALLTTSTLGQPALLQAAPTYQGSSTQVAANTFVNPSYDEINQLLEEVAKEKGIPSAILKAIAFKESSWRQFDKLGEAIVSRPVHPAIGIMQVATYNDNDLETIEKLKTDIGFNIRRGADLLNEKWGFTPTIGDGDRNKLENWYFALWAYNVWTDKNNPNVCDPSTLTYQEKVFNLIAHPEGFLAQYIEPVGITRIPAESLPATGLPLKTVAWATPEPIHYGDLAVVVSPEIPTVPVYPPSRGGVPDLNPPQEPQTIEFLRLETAVQQALEGWPTGAETVILARADRFPDALAGVPLAARYDAPILLTSGEALNSEVEQALKILNPDRVLLLGGEGALGPQVAAKLESLGWSGEGLQRINGLNRYETAAAIALETAGLSRDILTDPNHSEEAVAIVTGLNFPDALSIASIAGIKQMPILLTESGALPQETWTALKALNPKKIYLIGGEGVIAPAVATDLQEQLKLAGPVIERLSGASRYDTMAAVAAAFAGEGQGLAFATGQDFPDALTGAALAVRLNSKVILIPQGPIEAYPRLKETIAQHPYNPEAKQYIFGGNGAISSERVQELKVLLGT
ncbi:cell wall-binding protein [Desulfitobacterium dichloroeliminans LMG P-21439]|uniref:Cell wall-binding protein n=1 Tax=Desulfitobacterium dichloroeliminans (strain LMG P-21439 / DCA1) TaxID=871963 RepID=L0FCG3_DESDL|nr:cell wall-binding repeat-containing protein [Desulfitobacterium dichloroeliminans]AGA70633.1 cell wall-binding protein [Desulfitobacterium dichloroeliminans LMG P-21439]